MTDQIESECCREDALAWEPCAPFQELQMRVADLEDAIRRAHEWLTNSAPTLDRRVFQATGILANVLPATPRDVAKDGT